MINGDYSFFGKGASAAATEGFKSFKKPLSLEMCTAGMIYGSNTNRIKMHKFGGNQKRTWSLFK